MKRILCVMIAVLMVTVLAACRAETVLIHTMAGEGIDVSRSDLDGFKCVGSVDGQDDFTLTDKQAWKLRDYLVDLRIEANKTADPPESDHVMHMWFEAQWNGNRAELGAYTVYDSGVIGYSASLYSSNITFYTCGDGVYDKVAEIIHP